MKAPHTIEAEKAIHKALRHGATVRDIATLSGLSASTIERHQRGLTHCTDPEVASRILQGVELWVEHHPVDMGNPDISDERKLVLAEHVEALMEIGYDNVQLARIAGCDRYVIRDIRNRRLGRSVREPYADALEAIPADIRRKIASPRGATRRLQALVRWGYEPSQLARELHTTEGEIERLLAEPRDDLDPALARTIPAAAARLEQIPGRSDAARERGEKAGWALPLQYDEYAVDSEQTAVAKPYRPYRDEPDLEQRMSAWVREVEQLAAEPVAA
ncbi:antirepressor [Gordonia phage Mollymur]|uniref:Antirepressor n=1 Tax=Gordonia phage Mollymur TaxID=2590895 RepID=A0A4Y6EKU9_9CAUD|nr:antirepressor [Gordonia phage Mollymur]QDF15449.1 antirepressor [Gordonia phage Mollymur]